MTKKIPAVAVSLLWMCAFASARPQQASASGGSSTSGSKSGSSSTKGSSKKKASSKKRRVSKREPVQKAPTPDRIMEIQSALARNGYYQGQPNGKWDANTVAAMQKFQSENGLESTGKLDALSLQKLGLGSSVAGVSAPRPPVPAGGASSSGRSSPAPSNAPSAAPNTAPSQQGTPKPSSQGFATEIASSISAAVSATPSH